MSKIMNINNSELRVKEYQGQRVVTLKDIDTVHGRPEGTARKRFNDNKHHFAEGIDYYIASPKSSMYEKHTLGKIPPKGLTLLTESGYLLLVKSFTDDLAWQVQRQLVNAYFRCRETQKEKSTPERVEIGSKMMKIREFDGRRVLTLNDVDFVHKNDFESARKLFHDNIKHFSDGGIDYYTLLPDNPRYNEFRAIGEPLRPLYLLTESGYHFLARCFRDDFSYHIQRQLMLRYFRDEDSEPSGRLLSSPQNDMPIVLNLSGNLEIQSLLNSIKSTLTSLDTIIGSVNTYCITMKDWAIFTQALSVNGKLLLSFCDELLRMSPLEMQQRLR